MVFWMDVPILITGQYSAARTNMKLSKQRDIEDHLFEWARYRIILNPWRNRFIFISQVNTSVCSHLIALIVAMYPNSSPTSPTCVGLAAPCCICIHINNKRIERGNRNRLKALLIKMRCLGPLPSYNFKNEQARNCWRFNYFAFSVHYEPH